MRKIFVSFMVFLMLIMHPSIIVAQSGENIFSNSEEDIVNENTDNVNITLVADTKDQNKKTTSPIIIIPQFPEENNTTTTSSLMIENTPDTSNTTQGAQEASGDNNIIEDEIYSVSGANTETGTSGNKITENVIFSSGNNSTGSNYIIEDTLYETPDEKTFVSKATPQTKSSIAIDPVVSANTRIETIQTTSGNIIQTLYEEDTKVDSHEAGVTGNIATGVITTGTTLTGDVILTGDILTGNTTLTGNVLTWNISTGTTLTGDTILTGNILTGNTTLTGDVLTGNISTGTTLTGNVSTGAMLSGDIILEENKESLLIEEDLMVFMNDQVDKEAYALFSSGIQIQSTQKKEINPADLLLEEIHTSSTDVPHPESIIAQFELGPNNDHLIFSQPVKVEISIASGYENKEVEIQVKHLGDSTFNTKGIGVSDTATCDTNGNISPENNKTYVHDGKVIFYTCGASTFTVSYVGGANTDNFVDNTSKTKIIAVTTGDVATGSTITKMTVTIDFRSIDGTNPGNPGTGNSFASQNSFKLRSPAGTEVSLLTTGTYSDSSANRVTVTFDDSAGSAPSGTPSTGTFTPAQNLSTFNGEDPLGDRELIFADDTLDDGLTLYEANIYFDANECGGSDAPTYYLDADADGFSAGEAQKSCTDPGTDRYLATEMMNTSLSGSLINNGVVGYRSFDAKDAVDDSENGHNGTVHNVLFESGKIANDGIFDNSSSYISIADDATLDLTTELTMSAWVTAENLDQRDSVLMKTSSGSWTDGYGIYHNNTTNQICAFITHRNNYKTCAPFNATETNYKHIVATYDHSNLILYIDGTEVARSAINIDISTNNADFEIGRGGGSSYYRGGHIDDVRLYNRALHSDEVQKLWKTTNLITNGDCDDNNDQIYPTALEYCNNIDDDCDDIIDNNVEQIPDSECHALIDLYTGTNGDNRTNKSGWLLDTDIENWFGIRLVTVGTGQHVKEICLGDETEGYSSTQSCHYNGNGNNLIGTIPDSIGNFPELVRLTLAHNAGLSGGIPSTIGNLSKLYYLWINNSTLGGTLPVSLGNLNNLKYLYSWSNNLTGSIPNERGTGMSNIYYIHLAYNHLQGNLPDNRGNLSTLRLMMFNNNNLTGEIPDSPWSGLNLSHFYVHNNELSGPIPEFFGNMSNLKYQYLYNNEFSGPIPDSYANLQNNGIIFRLDHNNFDRNPDHTIKFSPTVQTRYDNITPYNNDPNRVSIIDQGDIISPVLSNGDSIPAEVTGAFTYHFHLYEGSYSTGNGYTGFSMEIQGYGSCNGLEISPSTTAINSGTVTVTLDPTVAGTYSGCQIKITDHGNTLGNGHHDEHSGTITLDTFCFASGTLYFDNDGDGWGDPSITTGATCSGTNPPGYVGAGGDCDDNNANISPGTQEICNGISDDCDAEIDESVDIPTSECQALIDLYNGTDGDNRTTNSGRLTDPNTDNRYGIEHTSVGGVNHISKLCLADETESDACTYNKDGNNLVGTLSGSLGNLTELTQLHLSRNPGLTGGLPVGLGNLKKVTHFYIVASSIGGTLPDDIGGMTSLKYFYARSNGFTGSIPASFSGLSSLIYLHLSSNNLTGGFPTQLYSLAPHLRYLVLSSNNLGGTIPDDIGTLDHLEYLYLSNNNMTGPLPDSIGDISPLRILLLDGNAFTGELPLTWSGINLSHLYLYNNELSGPFPEYFGNMSRMKYFQIYNNEFTGTFPESFANMQTSGVIFKTYQNNFDRNADHTMKLSPTLQSRYDSLTPYGGSSSYINITNQGDITSPILTNGSTIPEVVTGSFAYSFDIDEGSYSTGNGYTGFAISFSGASPCDQLSVNPDTIETMSGTVNVTITPNIEGYYNDCELIVSDHGNELGNGHSTANTGSIVLNNFCYGNQCNGDICIDTPSGLVFSGTYQSENYTQSITQSFTGYFTVSDTKGADSGYYTTLQITDLTGPSGTISNTNISRKASGPDYISGDVNTGIVLESVWSNYFVATGVTTFIKRDTGTNNSKTSTYGAKPDIKIDIPPYTKAGTYQGTITYTLYEN